MKKYTNDLKTMVEVIIFALLWFIGTTLDSPIVTIISFLFFIFYLLYQLYEQYCYRKGRVYYVLYPTKKDCYSKITLLILGSILLVSSIVIVVTKNCNQYAIISFVFGLLLFLNGLFDLPKGKLIICDSTLIISGINEQINLQNLKEINIFKDRILLSDDNDSVKRVDNVALDFVSSKVLEKYILENTQNFDLKVINNLL